MALAYRHAEFSEPSEFILTLEPEIISALNKWRLQQVPVLEPNEALLMLLRKALSSEGLLPSPNDNPVQDPALKTLIAAFRQASGARPSA